MINHYYLTNYCNIMCRIIHDNICTIRSMKDLLYNKKIKINCVNFGIQSLKVRYADFKKCIFELIGTSRHIKNFRGTSNQYQIASHFFSMCREMPRNADFPKKLMCRFSHPTLKGVQRKVGISNLGALCKYEIRITIM